MLLHANSAAQPARPTAWFRALSDVAIFHPTLSTAIEGISADLKEFPRALQQLQQLQDAHSSTPQQMLDALGAPPESAELAAAPEMPGASAARGLPSTRAGGQDDVSSQANSLK